MQAEQKRRHDAHSKFQNFEVGQTTLVWNLRKRSKWIVLEQTGPVSYRVQVSDQIWCHHTDQLLDHNAAVRDSTPELSNEPDSREMLPSRSDQIPIEAQETVSPERSDSCQSETDTPIKSKMSAESPCYPQREHRPPYKF